MTKADLVEQVTAAMARTAGPLISKKDCARVVDAFLDAIKLALREQQNIEVRGFGTFKIRKRKTLWKVLNKLRSLLFQMMFVT
jgi:nucleoid DNA-binding protein